MSFDFVILGATGLQGRIVARDLLERGYSLLLCDQFKAQRDSLPEQLKALPFVSFDVRDHEHMVEKLKQFNCKIVINCALDDYVLLVLKACIEASVHHIDLGSYSDVINDQLALDSVLKEKGLIAITGCGAVPGIGNVMLKYAAPQFDSIHTIETGFCWDSNIKKFVTPFSMDAIFWEFTRSAHPLEHGRIVKKNPMDTITKRTFKKIGEQQIMLVDHPEPHTFYHYFKDKGLQHARFYAGFPQHAFEKIKTLVELGFHKHDKKVIVDGGEVTPLDVAVETLRLIKHPDGYQEIENLWVDIYGEKDGKPKMVKMECIAPTQPGWEDAGCNIDTGFPASIIAQMVKKGVISTPGSHSPEGVVPEQAFFSLLREKGMVFYENGKLLKEHQEVPQVIRRRT
jgi:saccharopine dehydrogenase-like NADP-dependent oxidoreductase